MDDIKLTDQDKKELLDYLNDYSKNIPKATIDEIDKKLNKKINKLKHKRSLPGYVKVMGRQIEDLSLLLRHSNVEDESYNKVVAALYYFILPEDRIPDYIPVIGYLDDAFIISVVHSDVKKEINKVKQFVAQ